MGCEEMVWSPKYGLKGNIDATLIASMESDNHESKQLFPFELKSGRKAYEKGMTAHRAQVTNIVSS